MERQERLRREQYRARRNKETAKERESRLEGHDVDRAVILVAINIVAVEKAS